jgi:hypothetical protein
MSHRMTGNEGFADIALTVRAHIITSEYANDLEIG